MIKKIIISLVAVALFIVAVGIFLQKSSVIAPTPVPISAKPTATINDVQVSLSLAKTAQEREKGLGGVTSLDPNTGMLFVFDNPDTPQAFWMKGMLIPIDMIWIKNDTIVRVDKNIPTPSPDTPDTMLKVYSAGIVVDYVLEVNGGFSDKNSIKQGDAVTFSGI